MAEAVAFDALSVLLGSVDFVWSIDTDRRLVHLSDGFTRVTGYPVTLALGRRPEDLPWFRVSAEAIALRQTILAARAPLRDMLFVVTRHDGAVRLLSVSGQPRFDSSGAFAGYSGIALDVTESTRAEAMLEKIAQMDGGASGDDYFRTLVRSLRGALDADLVFIGQLTEERTDQVTTIAVRARGSDADNFAYDLAGTPFAGVIGPDVRVQAVESFRLFPGDALLVDRGIEAYCGAPLFDAQGRPLGVLVALRIKPFGDADLARNVLRVFAGRAASELERQVIERSLRESQELLRQSQRIGRTGYIVSDMRAGRVIWSETMFELRGVPPQPSFSFEEAMAFIHPEDRHIVDAALRTSVAEQRPYEIEVRIIRPDGQIIWERSIGHPLFDAAGEIKRRLVFVQEITQQKLAEQALFERERQLQAILDNAPMAIFLKDRDARYRLVNKCFEDWFGLGGDHLYGATGYGAFAAVSAQINEETDRIALQEGRVSEMERPTTGAPSGIEHVQVTKFPIRDAEGFIVGLAGFITDITERKRAEILLREKEQEQRAILDNAPIAMFLKDREGRYRLVNRRFEQWFDRAQADIEGLTDADIAPPEVAELSAQTEDEVLRRGDEVTYERRVYGVAAADLERLLITKYPIRAPDESIVGIAGFLTDVTLRWQAEEALRESEERFRALIEHSNDFVAIIDLDGTLRYHSPSVSQGLGFGQAAFTGRSIMDLVHREDMRPLAAALGRIAKMPGAQEAGEGRVRHKNGGWRHVAWTARNATNIRGVEGVIVNGRDVTDARRLEEQLQQAQKMEAIGQLAGGIAHDFNNILGVVLGFSSFLVQDLPAGSPEFGFAARIHKAGERARDLVRQLLAFSRQAGVERQPEDLGRVVLDTAELLRGSLPSSTRLEIQSDTPGLVARVNAGQIGQVLLNLCLNANDALNGEPGSITIALVRIPPGVAGLPAGSPADSVMVGSLDPKLGYACISVSDTGGGMAPNVLRRAFDPFFTTKERGRGTGLGLAMVHGIVTSGGGACLVTSRPGAGTTFALHFPLVEQVPAQDPSRNVMRDPHGRERILVVDDDVDLTDMLTTGLDRLGYETVACNDPREAMRAFDEDPDAWDVVISDQVMPDIKGLVLFERMKARKPSIRFILCTGFSDGATEEMALARGISAYFLKPVSVERLAESVRDLMQGRTT